MLGRMGQFKVNDAHQKHVNERGMHWFMASVFIVAEMCGAGVVALPVTLGHAGILPGVVLLVLGAFFSGFTGVQLSQNWTIMQRRWAEYREHCRRPYPEMAYRALGSKAKYAMDVCLAFTLYGVERRREEEKSSSMGKRETEPKEDEPDEQKEELEKKKTLRKRVARPLAEIVVQLKKDETNDNDFLAGYLEYSCEKIILSSDGPEKIYWTVLNISDDKVTLKTPGTRNKVQKLKQGEECKFSTLRACQYEGEQHRLDAAKLVKYELFHYGGKDYRLIVTIEERDLQIQLEARVTSHLSSEDVAILLGSGIRVPLRVKPGSTSNTNGYFCFRSQGQNFQKKIKRDDATIND